MYGYNTKYFNKNFLDSFRNAINDSLSTAGTNNGIGYSKKLHETTTSGRESGIGPGKTLLPADKTWDEVAREDLDKLVKGPAENKFTGQKNQFAGKNIADIKLERKDGKIYADGVELSTASTKTGHYASDAPTRAGMSATKPAAPAAVSYTHLTLPTKA